MLKKVSLFILIAGYFLAGINHFVHPHFYSALIPSYFPFPQFLVALSGAAEILLAILLIPLRTRKAAAMLIALMLILFLTVHIQMALHPVTHRYAVYPAAAWLRLALQPLLIAWVLVHAGLFHKKGRA